MRERYAAFDFGSDSTKIYAKEIYMEKTMLVIEEESQQVKSFGNDAYEYFERLPKGFELIFPIQNGKIADLWALKMYIELFTKKYKINRRQQILLAVPDEITDIEQRAYREVFSDWKRQKEMHLIKRPLADAVGAGLMIERPEAAMIVNIGAQTTEMTVIASEGIIASHQYLMGSQWLDEMIVYMVKKRHQIQIGKRTGKLLKYKYQKEIQEEEIKGMDLYQGIPITFFMDFQEMRELFEEFFEMLSEGIKELIEKLPGDVAADLITQGICLTGGGSGMERLPQYLEQTLGIPVRTAGLGEKTVILGLEQWFTKDRK